MTRKQKLVDELKKLEMKLEKENKKFSSKERRMRVECLMCGEADHFAKDCYYNPINMNHSWAKSCKLKPNKKVEVMNRGAGGSEYPSAVNHVHKSKSKKKEPTNKASAVPKSRTADRKINSSAAPKSKTADNKFKPSVVPTSTAYRKGKSSAASKPTAADKQKKRQKVQPLSKQSPAATTSTIPSVAASSSAAKVYSNPKPHMVWKAKAQQFPTSSADENKPQTSVPNLKLKVFHYFVANGRPKTTEAWVPIRN